MQRKRPRGGRRYLELMSKLILEPCRHRRFRPITREEQEILEIYDLGENRQLLVKVFGEFWWSSIRWDKLESSRVNGITSLLDVRTSDVVQSHDYRPSHYPERCLGYEFPIMPSNNVYERFKRLLSVFRLEANHGG